MAAEQSLVSSGVVSVQRRASLSRVPCCLAWGSQGTALALTKIIKLDTLNKKRSPQDPLTSARPFLARPREPQAILWLKPDGQIFPTEWRPRKQGTSGSLPRVGARILKSTTWRRPTMAGRLSEGHLITDTRSFFHGPPEVF